jgi:hypothetical protein
VSPTGRSPRWCSGYCACHWTQSSRVRAHAMRLIFKCSANPQHTFLGMRSKAGVPMFKILRHAEELLKFHRDVLISFIHSHNRIHTFELIGGFGWNFVRRWWYWRWRWSLQSDWRLNIWGGSTFERIHGFGCNFVWGDDIEDDLDSTLFNPVTLHPFQHGGRLNFWSVYTYWTDWWIWMKFVLY